jgi:DNA-binding NarL/FixJ family response regulator
MIGELPDGGVGHITVVFGHFDALVSRGLTQILREDRDLQIIGTDLDNATLAHVIAQRAPRVAILDETNVGPPSVERLRTAHPTLGIVVLADHPTRAYGMRLLAAGASCLSKDAPVADILTVVHTAAEGRRVFMPVEGCVVGGSYPADAASLTPREVEVLEYLSKGQSHAEIALALQLSVETIRTHAARIRGKLGVRSKRELIGLAVPAQFEAESR